MDDENAYVLVRQHVDAGEKVWNGYAGGEMYCTAPSMPGKYSLYEVVGPNNEHKGWWWEKE